MCFLFAAILTKQFRQTLLTQCMLTHILQPKRIRRCQGNWRLYFQPSIKTVSPFLKGKSEKVELWNKTTNQTKRFNTGLCERLDRPMMVISRSSFKMCPRQFHCSKFPNESGFQPFLMTSACSSSCPSARNTNVQMSSRVGVSCRSVIMLPREDYIDFSPSTRSEYILHSSLW